MPQFISQGYRGFTNTLTDAQQSVTIVQCIPRTAYSAVFAGAVDPNLGVEPIPLYIVRGLHPLAPTAFAPGEEFREVTLAADLNVALLFPLAMDRNPVIAQAKLFAPPLTGEPFWVAFWDGDVLADRPDDIQYNVWCARRAGT